MSAHTTVHPSQWPSPVVATSVSLPVITIMEERRLLASPLLLAAKAHSDSTLDQQLQNNISTFFFYNFLTKKFKSKGVK